MGGVRKGAAGEDWCWDLNPVMAAMQSGNHKALAGGLGTICLWGASFLLHGLGSRRDLARKKRGERTLGGGP